MAIRRGWICLAFQLLMAIVDARTIQDLPDGHVRNNLCTPVNISVVLTSWQPVCITLHWACGHRMPNGEWFYVNLRSLEELNKEKERTVSPDELSAFRITYRAYNTRYKFIQEVPPFVNRTNIDNLQPNQKYTLTISSLSFNNPEGVSSKEVDFVSPAVVVSQPNPNNRFYNSFSSLRLDTDMNSTNMKPGEVFVVICVLCIWLFIIFHFIKKWGKIRSLEPNTAHQSTVRTGKSIVETDSLNGAQSATKSRLQSFANVTTIPKLHMSESHNSLYDDDHQSLLGANNCMHHLSVLSPRLRQNSVFLTSPTRRGSFFPDESKLPRRYKSAEDLQSLVLEITNVQRQQRKLSQFSIKESDHLENCTLISEADRTLLAGGAHATAAYSAANQHSGSTTRGSISAASRGSNGTLKLTDIAAVALAASNSQLSRIASPSKSSSSRELIAGAGSSSGTASTSGSKQSQGKLPRHKNSIVPIQVVDSSDSNHSTQATIASCERDLESSSGTTNCIFCRRRISNCDECTHCNGLNMGSIANRNMVLMQSKSFVNHTCSTENSQNSSFENPCTTSVSNLNVATSLTSSPASQPQPFRSSQPCLFQISEATDDIKHIDED